ncbi:MAG TPA: hypothetical protein VIC33_02180 [Vicinamibacterales bacterium]
MPNIRFTRDRRGYEHTCIVQASRRRGKKESRLLYWFRTPPNVKVGRVPIDEDAIRAIEHHNPDLAFDWTRILDSRPPAPSEPPTRPARRQRPLPSPPTRAERPLAVREAVQPRAPEEPSFERQPDAAESLLADAADIGQADGLAEIADANLAEPPFVPESARPVPAEELVGVEGLARLRTLHAELLARITERGSEPARLDDLRREAERLNPDAWVTLDEARQALEQYEIVAETFRRSLGRRRRSRRGGRRGRRRPADAQADGQTGAPTDAPADDDSPESDD